MPSSAQKPAISANPRQRQVELPTEPPHAEPETEDFRRLHTTAARVDGTVKVLTGMVLVFFSLGGVILGAVGLYALLHQQQVRLWALGLGLPGVAMAIAGLVLIVIGAYKVFSGRGHG